MKSNTVSHPGSRFTAIIRFVVLYLAMQFAVAIPAHAITQYSGASIGANGTINGWGVTDAYQGGMPVHTAYVATRLTSPHGRVANSGQWNGSNWVRADVYLSWDATDLGTYTTRSDHSYYCPFIQCTIILASTLVAINVQDLASFRTTVMSAPITGETDSLLSGQSGQVKVEAIDTAGAVFTGYRGTVRFTSGDTTAALPTNYTYSASDNGVHTFNVTLKTVANNSATRDLSVEDTIKGKKTTKNINVWFRVFATREGLVGGTTACGHIIVANDHFVALPATGLCSVGVRLANGTFKRNESVSDVGPWCPNTPGGGNQNPCNCGSDRYWQTTGHPLTESMTCDSNNSGIDLADGTFYDLGLTGNAYIYWRFL